MKRNLALLVAAMPLFPGCLVFPAQSETSSAQSSYKGDECSEVRMTREEDTKYQPSFTPKEASGPRDEVLLALCPEIDYARPDPGYAAQGGVASTLLQKKKLPHPEAIHQSFDLRHPQMIAVGSMMVGALRGEDSIQTKMKLKRRAHQAAHPNPNAIAEEQEPDDRVNREMTVTGMAAAYASFLDDAALDRELATTNLPDGARQKYKALLKDSAQKLTAEVNAMSPAAKHVVYEVPLHVAQSIQHEYAAKKQLADMLDEIEKRADAARAGTGDAKTVAQDLTSFRTTLFNACGATEPCTYHPLYVEATHELATLYVTMKEPALARAESAVLYRKNALQGTFQAATYAAQTDAGGRSTAALATQTQAGRMDAKLAKAANANGPAVSFTFASFFRADMSMPFLATVLDGKEAREESTSGGTVQSLTPKGDKVLVEFRTEYYDADVDYNCVKTGRITRINRDGTIDYEENCQHKTERHADPKPDPLLLSKKEAAQIKVGESVSIWVNGKEGVVYQSNSRSGTTSTLVQFRGDRVRSTSGASSPYSPVP